MLAEKIYDKKKKPQIRFILSPEFKNDTKFRPMDVTQQPFITVRKCLFPKICKDESEIIRFFNDFRLDFQVRASNPGFESNPNSLNFQNKFVQTSSISLENPPSSNEFYVWYKISKMTDTHSRFSLEKTYNSTAYIELVSQSENRLRYVVNYTKKISTDRGKTFKESEFAFYY